jgi:chaperone modulatory protein CbpM
MSSKKFIPVDEFCLNHQIDSSFVSLLQDTGLIELTKRKHHLFFDAVQLQQLEKIVCFHYELDINLEGIESIAHLIDQIDALQEEIIGLKNRLRFYEQPNNQNV